MEADLLEGFLAALPVVDLDRAGICGRLVNTAHTRARAVLRAQQAAASGEANFTPGPALPRPPYGHPDLVLLRAVKRGVLTAAEADLIGVTRLETVSLTEYAQRAGLSDWAAYKRRRKAEQRLVEAFRDGELSEWATTDPNKRFHDLFNLVADLATLRVAWPRVRTNRGARSAGVDGVSCTYVEQQVGEEAFLRELRDRLKQGTYRPEPVRERAIPKKGGKIRRLGIPTVADRVVQMALKLVLEPIFEPDQYRSSYAYRPGRRAQDAVAEIVHYVNNGYSWVVEGDIEGCFDNIRHSAVIERLRRRVTDRKVINLCKAFLKAGVLTELGRLERRVSGTPQGGVISPLFANLALAALDEPFQAAWAATSKYRNQRSYLRSKGIATYRLIRYSDDFVTMVHGTRAQAAALKADTAAVLASQGLQLSEAKTHITHVDSGFDFLGFRIQRRPREGKTACAYTFMSKANFQATKRKVKAWTRRNRLNLVPV